MSYIQCQGWEFAHRFLSEWLDFCPKMSDWAIRSKNERFAHFWWATWANERIPSPDTLVEYSFSLTLLNMISLTVYCTYNRVEWFSTFFDCWKPTHFCWLGIFLYTIQKNQQFRPRAWATHARQSFNFQNITKYLWKLVNTFLIHQRTIYKKKICKKNLFIIHFYFQKMG